MKYVLFVFSMSFFLLSEMACQKGVTNLTGQDSTDPLQQTLLNGTPVTDARYFGVGYFIRSNRQSICNVTLVENSNQGAVGVISKECVNANNQVDILINTPVYFQNSTNESVPTSYLRGTKSCSGNPDLILLELDPVYLTSNVLAPFYNNLDFTNTKEITPAWQTAIVLGFGASKPTDANDYGSLNQQTIAIHLNGSGIASPANVINLSSDETASPLLINSSGNLLFAGILSKTDQQIVTYNACQTSAHCSNLFIENAALSSLSNTNTNAKTYDCRWDKNGPLCMEKADKTLACVSLDTAIPGLLSVPIESTFTTPNCFRSLQTFKIGFMQPSCRNDLGAQRWVNDMIASTDQSNQFITITVNSASALSPTATPYLLEDLTDQETSDPSLEQFQGLRITFQNNSELHGSLNVYLVKRANTNSSCLPSFGDTNTAIPLTSLVTGSQKEDVVMQLPTADANTRYCGIAFGLNQPGQSLKIFNISLLTKSPQTPVTNVPYASGQLYRLYSPQNTVIGMAAGTQNIRYTQLVTTEANQFWVLQPASNANNSLLVNVKQNKCLQIDWIKNSEQSVTLQPCAAANANQMWSVLCSGVPTTCIIASVGLPNAYLAANQSDDVFGFVFGKSTQGVANLTFEAIDRSGNAINKNSIAQTIADFSISPNRYYRVVCANGNRSLLFAPPVKGISLINTDHWMLYKETNNEDSFFKLISPDGKYVLAYTPSNPAILGLLPFNGNIAFSVTATSTFNIAPPSPSETFTPGIPFTGPYPTFNITGFASGVRIAATVGGLKGNAYIGIVPPGTNAVCPSWYLEPVQQNGNYWIDSN